MADPPTPASVHQAAKEGDLAQLRKATKKELNQGDDDGWTPTHWAAWNGSKEALRVILAKGYVHDHHVRIYILAPPTSVEYKENRNPVSRKLLLP